MLVILLAVLGIFLHSASANTSSCNVEDLRTCRADALSQMSRSNSDGVRQDTQCRDLRDNFNCMLWQTSMCFKKEDQDTNSDVILKTWRYLKGVCEEYISYWKGSCFQRDDVKRCESLLPSKSNSLDSQSCSMFVNFRECVVPIAESSCSNSDRTLLGSYFMEKGNDMAWRCPKDNDVGSMPSASAQQEDRRYPDMYGDSSYDCVSRARSELQTCRQRFEETQREATRRDDSDMRNHQVCCALFDYENCVKEGAKKSCGGDDADALIESTVDLMRKPLENVCKDYAEIEKCSSGDGASINSLSTLICFILYFAYIVLMKEF